MVLHTLVPVKYIYKYNRLFVIIIFVYYYYLLYLLLYYILYLFIYQYYYYLFFIITIYLFIIIIYFYYLCIYFLLFIYLFIIIIIYYVYYYIYCDITSAATRNRIWKDVNPRQQSRMLTSCAGTTCHARREFFLPENCNISFSFKYISV